MKIETKYNPGDKLFFVDLAARAPVGPTEVQYVDILCDPEPRIRYRFGGPAVRDEVDVFASHAEALKKASDGEWILSRYRA